jgi:GT2 family glycosyltransferase
VGVDVVIVSYNSEDHLRTCVEPLIAATDVRVLVVDSASTDRTLDAVADLPVTTIRLDVNRGFAHACNVGWRSAKSPFVLFLNPDASIDGASIRRLVDAVESDDAVAAAAPKILHGDGSLDYSMRRFPRLRSTYAQALFLHRLFPRSPWSDELVRDDPAYEQTASPDWVSGACLLVRRTVLEELGGFDDGFFLYCEDLDLCRRIRDGGRSIRFVPEAVTVHEGGASMPRTELLPVLAESRVRYARKHESSAVALAERLGIGLGAATHAVATRGGRPARVGHLRALSRAWL